ncbi:MAG: VacJ family lipoprotein, partial [Dehalococcoidia bacterium]|nr:VacJ family lipoprotein [Dehalococcoidia bacterium]
MRRSVMATGAGTTAIWRSLVLTVGLVCGLSGCAGLGRLVGRDSVRQTPQTAQAAATTTATDTDGMTLKLVQTQRAPGEKLPAGSPNDIEEEYDPWEPFNEQTFEFNRKLDRYILKPVAKGYNVVVPDQVQMMLSNGLDNIAWVPRAVNSVLQGKFEGALRELSRFMLNTTLGVGGLFDVGKHAGIPKSREDFGQTLGVWGLGPGPYLVLPLLEPMTVRDGIGKGVDMFMDPLGYFVPLIPVRLGMKATDTVNDRSLNL